MNLPDLTVWATCKRSRTVHQFDTGELWLPQSSKIVSLKSWYRHNFPHGLPTETYSNPSFLLSTEHSLESLSVRCHLSLSPGPERNRGGGTRSTKWNTDFWKVQKPNFLWWVQSSLLLARWLVFLSHGRDRAVHLAFAVKICRDNRIVIQIQSVEPFHFLVPWT